MIKPNRDIHKKSYFEAKIIKKQFLTYINHTDNMEL